MSNIEAYNYYDYIWNFSNGIAVVILNGKYGYINDNYDELCEFKYDTAFSFIDEYALVGMNNNKYGYINKLGKEVVPCHYTIDNANCILKKYITSQQRLSKLKIFL